MIYLHPGICPRRFGMQMLGNVHINQSPLNKAIKRSEFPGDMWVVQGEWPPMLHRELAAAEAFWNSFRGAAHTLRIWHMLRPVPRGTLRGTPTVGGQTPEGSNSILVLANQIGQTLLPGDMIGIPLLGSGNHVQLVQVRNSTTDIAMLHVDITPPLRRAAGEGVLVNWNRPTVDCVLTRAPFLTGIPKFGEGYTIEALELPFV